MLCSLLTYFSYQPKIHNPARKGLRSKEDNEIQIVILNNNHLNIIIFNVVDYGFVNFEIK